jgi:D-alanine transaminase
VSEKAATLLPIWIDGELRPGDALALRADDSAAAEGRGCYTTARVEEGAPCWPDRHVRRLVRDAAALGIGEVEPEAVRRALVELAAAAFGEGRGEGAIRLQASRDGDGHIHLLGRPRSLGVERDVWRAVSARVVHPGPTPWTGIKVTHRLEMAFAREQAASVGVDEAILFDREGRAVEGCRSNLLFAGEDGELAFIEPQRGAVAGVALEVVREAMPGLLATDLSKPAVGDVRELVAVNALRGARPVVELDGTPVGDGRPGPWCNRLAALLTFP